MVLKVLGPAENYQRSNRYSTYQVLSQGSSMTIERRNHARTNVRLSLFLLRTGSSVPFRTETENVAPDGLFCYSRYFFSPGDSLRFLLFLPAARREPEMMAAGMYIHGAAQVIRVSIGPLPGSYGIGCRLDNYRVVAERDLASLDNGIWACLPPCELIGNLDRKLG